MRSLLVIFIGGGLGSIVRYAMGRWVSSLHTHSFPLATLLVNVSACFLLGLVIGLADHRHLISPQARLFWSVGFCGGFSTFSTFSNETLALMQSGFTLSYVLYIILSLVLCVAATWCGMYLGKSF